METNGGNVIAAILKSHGVKHLYALCGGHISPILAGCKQIGIRVVDVRSEAAAVFAADAEARLSGFPGIAAVTAGPGVTNAVTALKNAQMAHAPVVLFGGAAATVLAGRGSLQDIDQICLVKSICKFTVTIKRTRDIAPLLERAIQKARSEVPGPVFVECPIDLLYGEALVREWYGIKSGAGSGGFKNRLLRFYLNHHLDRIFKGDTEKITSAPLKAVAPEPKPAQIAAAARMVMQARQPVMIVGSQAMLYPGEAQRLRSAIERLQMPVFLTGMARGLMGHFHRQQMRHHRKEALLKADLVILAGMPCDFRLNYGRGINSKARLIGINRSKTDLFLNRKPKPALHADPFLSLCRLADAVELSSNQWSVWSEILRQSDLTRDKEIAAMAADKTDGVNPIAFLLELEAFLEDNSLLIADGGDFIGAASYALRPRGPLRWLDPGPFGTLGVGGGFAVGARLANPAAEVWLLYGDGAAGYSLQEIDTCVRHNLPVIAVVGNDACWAQIARDQVKILEDDVGTVLRPSDYHIVAQGYGAKGFLIRTEAEIRPTLQAARQAARQGFAVLINVMIGKTRFREGSISM